jgi:hypothetical protein
MIRSYYYEINEGDTPMFVNAEKVGGIHKVDLEQVVNALNITEDQAHKVVDVSIILLCNDIRNCLEDSCSWSYNYKYSNDRDPVSSAGYMNKTLLI